MLFSEKAHMLISGPTLLLSHSLPNPLQILLGGAESMYLVLNIHRDQIVRDAVTQLSGMELAYPERLKRPMRIKFVGEEVWRTPDDLPSPITNGTRFLCHTCNLPFHVTLAPPLLGYRRRRRAEGVLHAAFA